MTTATRGGCISADSHVTEPGDVYSSRVDPKFRDRAPRLVHDDRLGEIMLIDNGAGGLVPYWLIAAAGRPDDEVVLNSGKRFEDLHRGGWDPAARLADQDRDGVVAEVIYPSTGMVLCNHPDAEYKKACFDAYNDWLAGYCAVDVERLIGIGQTALSTPDEGIRDLEAIKALGFRGVMLPGVPGQEDYDHGIYDEFWDAAIALDLPLSFHILTGGTNQLLSSGIRGPKINGFMTIIRGNQDIIGTMIFGGVFERHPRLRVVCVEADAGWAPHYMYRMDHAYKRHRRWLTAGQELSRPPSEHFRENVYLTFQDDWVAFRMTGLVNVERLMWANDFPHSDATWPSSQALLDEQTGHLSEWEQRRILHDNAAELYRIIV